MLPRAQKIALRGPPAHCGRPAPGIARPARQGGQGDRDPPQDLRFRAGGTLVRMASSLVPDMALANRHGPRSGEAG
jgi:hypothetical protein